MKHTKPQEDTLFKFEYEFSLPIIEWTNGCLGISSKKEEERVEHHCDDKEEDPQEEEEEEESIFSTQEGVLIEFPIPPLTTASCYSKNNTCLRKLTYRPSITPLPRYQSSIIIEEEEEESSSDEDLMPLTPISSIIEQEKNLLMKKIQYLDIHHHHYVSSFA